jgi:hypothetical protein
VPYGVFLSFRCRLFFLYIRLHLFLILAVGDGTRPVATSRSPRYPSQKVTDWGEHLAKVYSPQTRQ